MCLNYKKVCQTNQMKGNSEAVKLTIMTKRIIKLYNRMDKYTLEDTLWNKMKTDKKSTLVTSTNIPSFGIYKFVEKNCIL